MKIKSKNFRVEEGEQVDLQKWPTREKPAYKSKKKYKKHLEEHVEDLSELQRLHNASNRYAVLLIFQAMVAAGKDGAIRHVMWRQSTRRPSIQFQASERRGTGTRFSVAYHSRSTGTRPHRHLQR